MKQVLTVMALLAVIGCSRRSYESLERSTSTCERMDCVVVNMRQVAVELPLPEVTLADVVPIDSISVLDNGLYRSTVEVSGGRINHRLEPSSAGLTLAGEVTVGDTTRQIREKTCNQQERKEREKSSPDSRSSPAFTWWRLLAACLAVLLGLKIFSAGRRSE